MFLASCSFTSHQSKTQVKHFKKADEKVLAAARVITMQITSDTALELQTNLREDFTTMEKAPSRVLSWLKAPNYRFHISGTIRHYAK